MLAGYVLSDSLSEIYAATVYPLNFNSHAYPYSPVKAYEIIWKMRLFCNVHINFTQCNLDVKHMASIIDKIRQNTPGVFKAMPSVAQGCKMIIYCNHLDNVSFSVKL